MALSSPQPFNVLLGTVVGAGQALNWYDVVTDFGRYGCSYHGISQGVGGVQSGGGIAPGSKVWIAALPNQPIGHILFVVNKSWTINPDSDPQSFAVFPQVSGFELGKRLAGQITKEALANQQNRPNDATNDFVPGEWSMTSPHGGGGVGVELFRSWVRGGPMSGVTCFHDTELTRLTGMDFEFMTFGRSDYARRHGNSIAELRSKVFYPSEALQDLPPRDLEIGGPIHGGTQRFLAGQSPRGTPRMALFHEMLADDGSYVVTSAATVCLQRYCGIVVPEESQAVQDPTAPELVGEQPLDDDQVREAALQTPRPFVSLPQDERSGLAWVQHTLDLIESLTGVRGRGGFDRLTTQWVAQDIVPGVPIDLFHTTYTPEMWRGLPTSFQLTLDPILKEKTFYVGRSSLTLLPDGSVLIEDAYHSQCLMSGGNIMFSAPHDIVFSAGRNITAIAGSHVGLRADQNIDIAANEGAVNVKAEQQLSLLGGAGGVGGGVLIESRSLNDESKDGTGSDQTVGGVLVKSATGAYTLAQRVGIRSLNDMVIVQSPTRLELRSPLISAYAQQGVFVYHDLTGANPGYELTADAMVAPGDIIMQGNLNALGAAFFKQNITTAGGVGAVGSIVGASVGQGEIKIGDTVTRLQTVFTQSAKIIKALVTDITKILVLKTPLNDAIATLLGFSFWTSKQLRTDRTGAYELPETRWQSLSRRFGVGTGKVWTENPVQSPAGDNQPTAPFPGFEVWTATEAYRLEKEDLYIDQKTGLRTIPVDISDATLPADPKVTLDGNFRISDQ